MFSNCVKLFLQVGGVSRVSERLGQLETASQTWRSRVEQTDEVQFTVAGKMGQLGTQLLPPLPQPNLYKSGTSKFFTAYFLILQLEGIW